MSINSGVARSKNSSMMLGRPKVAGKIQKGSSHGAFISLASNMSTLNKAEQRRKEQFDKSLQREVHAIEHVISHRRN